MTTDHEHNKMVREFFEQKKREDPEKYAEVEQKHAVIKNFWKQVGRREQPVGLLGLQPAHISPAVGHEYSLDSIYEPDDDA